MQVETALQLIEAAYGSTPGHDDHSIGDQWVEILDALQRNNLAGFHGNLAVHKFVYFGTVHFDRWVSPSPFVVMPDSLQRFEHFLTALIDLEGHDSPNCLRLRLHQLRNVIFARHAHVYGRPGTQAQPNAFEHYLTELNCVPTPLDPNLRAAFEADRGELKHIIDGLNDHSLRTVIVTSLPYVLCLREMKINTTWQGRGVVVTLSPHFQPSEGFAAGSNAIAQPVGSTRWQAGTTDVRIEFDGLVDGDMFTPALRALPGQGREAVEGWPNSFTCCFSIIYDLFWAIREESGVTELWPPAPRDVSSVTVTIDTAHANGLAFKMRHLGMWMTVVNPDRSPLEISIPDLVPPPHWKRCRETAVSYLALGDTREALLFLNMGVESLLEERFKLLADATGDSEALGKVLDTRSVWKEAMELVMRDAPEAMEKIKWPDRETHQSRPTQIKLAHRFLAPRSNVRDAQKHYRSVCQSRNELVHGTLDNFIPVPEVTAALESFDWLVDNFIPAEKADVSSTSS